MTTTDDRMRAIERDHDRLYERLQHMPTTAEMLQAMTAMEARLTDRIITQLRYIQGLYAALILGVAILVVARVFT